MTLLASKAADGLRGAVDLLYPPICPLCYSPLADCDTVICFRCEHVMTPAPRWRCLRCGAGGFGAEPEPGRKCRHCPTEGAAWQGAFAVAPYRAQATQCVQRFKYHRRMELGETMGRLMRARLAPSLAQLGARIEIVAPVPLHWLRRVARGFNQSAVLADILARDSGLSFEPRLLRRVRHTRRQALLPPERRAANVAGAFSLSSRADVRDRGVLIVDDVMTTGHTIQECAKVLREAGAREVWVACFARAGLGHPDPEE